VYGTTYHNTFESAHKCYVCDGNIHSALLQCGLQLGKFIEKTPALPSLPDGFVCDSGKTIDLGDVDGNEQRAICHQCINWLKNSKHMSVPWSCHKCDKEWPQSVKRCGAQGLELEGCDMPPPSKGVKRKTTSQAKAKTKLTKKGKGPVGEVTVQSDLSPDIDLDSYGTRSNVESVGDDFSWGEDSTNRRSESK